MNNRVLHTPEGMRDLYGEAKQRKRAMMRAMRDVFINYRYEEMETPSIEYFDVFGSDIGTTPSKELYKFFDRDGNTLVLRPDFTPSVARAVSMHCSDDAFPVRVSYEGSTFVNSAEYEGRLKEATQMGVELIGDGSPEADAEVLSLTCETLLAAGFTEFQISIGEVDFFKSLAERSALPETVVEEVRRMISMKNFYGVGEILKRENYAGDVAEALIKMPQLFGGAEVLEEAAAYAGSAREKQVLDRLHAMQENLQAKDLARFVAYDFGMLSKMNYYTGIIFAAYTYGTGEPVAKGGRYDELLGHFGAAHPAVGAGFYIDQLTAAHARTQRMKETEA